MLARYKYWHHVVCYTYIDIKARVYPYNTDFLLYSKVVKKSLKYTTKDTKEYKCVGYIGCCCKS